MYDAFSSPAIDVFLTGPVYGNVDPKNAEKDYEGLKKKDYRCLLMTLYRVRCNLFHGSKSLLNERDQQLVRASAVILEGFLKVLLQAKLKLLILLQILSKIKPKMILIYSC